MRKQMSRFQLAANCHNGQMSTGPKTPNGKAVSKMNALKHGLRSREVVLRGRCIRENAREFAALHQRLWDDLQPVGLREEILAEQIITTYWRLRRVLKAESGEISLHVDNGEWNRKHRDISLETMSWGLLSDPVTTMRGSAIGNRVLRRQLQEIHASVEKEGHLTEAAIQSVIFRGKPYSLTKELEALRLKLQLNPEGLDESALRAKQKEEALTFINRKIRSISWSLDDCEKHERMQEEAQQAADILPSAETLEKLRRYEMSLNKQFYRAMHELERLQRRRLGENIPPPQILEISNGS